MRRRTRRRGARPLWFPPLGVDFTIGETTDTVGFTTFQIQVPNDGSINEQHIPLTFDFGQERVGQFANAVIPTQTLADLMSSAWRCRRVVGKIHAAFQPGSVADNVFTGQATAVPACAFAAGLMVRNADSQGDVANVSVNLFQRDDYTDPWIWRRQWVLGQSASYTTFGSNAWSPGSGSFQNQPIGAANFDQQSAFTQFPNTTAGYGSVMDGPHIDAKTNRVVGPEDRLFIHFATKALPIQPQGNYQESSSVVGMYDLRLLGGLMKATNRRNAAR